MLPTVAAYVAENKAEWLRNPAAATNPTRFSGVRPTVGEAIAQLEQQLLIERAPESKAVTGSFFGTYRFDTGRLNGPTLGGGAHYRGPAHAGGRNLPLADPRPARWKPSLATAKLRNGDF